MTTRSLGLLALLVTTGCNVFDESLYLAREDAGADVADASVRPITLAERCSGAVPEITRSSGEYSFDTSGLANDLSDLASCTGRTLPGNDGFFRVRMTEGELWHFHVRTLDRTQNPAIYILPTCDERACTAGLDECGVGRDEHVSIRARETRDYFIGVDSAQAGGGRYEITVLRATCGDGVREHGESCDDRNRTAGDGCDEHCRVELRDGMAEVEPNDDFSDPNMIMASTGAVTVQGRLGGRCDFDMFGVTVPAGASVRATMLDVNGQPCPEGTPSFRMSWILPDGRTTGGMGPVTGTNRCPAITASEAFAQSLSTAGTYHVRVTTAAELDTAVDYKLRFEVVTP